jgi:hypothetical protein
VLRPGERPMSCRLATPVSARNAGNMRQTYSDVHQL